MTEEATPQGADAQPAADVNENVIDSAAQETLAEPLPLEEEKEIAFPKKAVNAISYRDKKIGRLQAQAEQLAAENRRLQDLTAKPAQNQPKGDGRPAEKDYQNYADYLEAVNDWKIDQKFNAFDGKQRQTQQSQQEQVWVSQQESVIASKAQSFAKEHPDIADLVEENADIVDNYPMSIKRLFLEAGEYAPMAFYNLAKEGKLEDLASMSPARAAIEIGRAASLAIAKQQTKAPAPLPTSRGSVPGGKDPSQMTDAEFNEWRRKSLGKQR